MDDKIPCTECGKLILPTTAKNTGGFCMPCAKHLGVNGKPAEAPKGPGVFDIERDVTAFIKQHGRCPKLDELSDEITSSLNSRIMAKDIIAFAQLREEVKAEEEAEAKTKVKTNKANKLSKKQITDVLNTPIDFNLLEQEFIAFGNWWKHNDEKMISVLRSGCSDEDIAKAEAGLNGLKLPEDIIELYKWHDGLEDDQLIYDIGNGRPFLSLQAALAERDLMMDSLGEAWDSTWLPIMGEADMGFFIMLDKKRKNHSALYSYNLQSDPITLHYINVLGMLSTIRAALEAEVLLPINDQGDDYYEVFLSDELDSIRKKHNAYTYPFVKKTGITFFDWPEPD